MGDRVGAAGDPNAAHPRRWRDPVLELRATRRLAVIARQKDGDRRAVGSTSASWPSIPMT
jgi:hypothetical protein